MRVRESEEMYLETILLLKKKGNFVRSVAQVHTDLTTPKLESIQEVLKGSQVRRVIPLLYIYGPSRDDQLQDCRIFRL